MRLSALATKAFASKTGTQPTWRTTTIQPRSRILMTGNQLLQCQDDQHMCALQSHTHLTNENNAPSSQHRRVSKPDSSQTTSASQDQVDELENMLVRMHKQRAARQSSQTSSPAINRLTRAPHLEAAESFAKIKWRQAPGFSHNSSCHAKVESS